MGVWDYLSSIFGRADVAKPSEEPLVEPPVSVPQQPPSVPLRRRVSRVELEESEFLFDQMDAIMILRGGIHDIPTRNLVIIIRDDRRDEISYKFTRVSESGIEESSKEEAYLTGEQMDSVKQVILDMIDELSNAIEHELNDHGFSAE